MSDIVRKRNYAATKDELEVKKEKMLASLGEFEKNYTETYLNLGTSSSGGNAEDVTSRTLTNHEERAFNRRRKHNKSVKNKLQRLDEVRFEAAVDAAAANAIIDTAQHGSTSEGYLEVDGEMERTYQMTQKKLKRNHLDENMARQIYDLKLEDYGPYQVEFNRSGRYNLTFGQAGHVAMMDCHQLGLQTEMHLNETVRDACFLHNETLFAVAQKKYAYIYDNNGTEIHQLKDHIDPCRLQFLPYHWLLASVGRAGYLHYTDTSTGQFISKHRTRLGSCSVMRQNPSNAVMHLGHGNGVVTLWSPASSGYLVKMLCHRGPVQALAVDPSGKYMVTGGADRQVKVWDLRTYKILHEYYSPQPAVSLDVSQSGLLGVGHGTSATMWKDAFVTKAKSPYMKHRVVGSDLQRFRFRPYEDVGIIGHSNGVASIVIPGAGEANFDSLEVNPFQDVKQRNEAEVRSLLDKLTPEMISLDPNVIGTLDRDIDAAREEKKKLAEEAELRNSKNKKPKNKMRGRGKIGKKIQRKKAIVWDANSTKYRAHLEEKKADDETSPEAGGITEMPLALKRFTK